MVNILISGAQTGADQGGLRAAKALGIETGGYMPKGWKTEEGPKPEFEEEYGMIEHDSPNYEDRTQANIKLATATIIFGRRSRGSNLTEELCRKLEKPCIWVWWPAPPEGVSPGGLIPQKQNTSAMRLWLKRHNVTVLNCAGNRESKNPGVGEFTENFLKAVLK